MKRFALILAVSSLGFLVPSASADNIQFGLNDWCFSVNGDTSVCNGSTATPAGYSVDLTHFDTTKDPDINNPTYNIGGTSSVLLSGAGNYSVGFYGDYDILSPTNLGSNNDGATTGGTLGAGQSWGAGAPDPANGLGLFGAGLTNSNTQTGTPHVGGGAQCCDMAFATSFDVLLGDGGAATVSFTVSTTAPGSGIFYVDQYGNNGGNLYLYGNVDVTNPGNFSPEPSTFLLGGGVLAAIGYLGRRKRARSSNVQ